MFRKDEFELVGVDVRFWILFPFAVVCCPLSYVSLGLSLSTSEQSSSDGCVWECHC